MRIPLRGSFLVSFLVSVLLAAVAPAPILAPAQSRTQDVIYLKSGGAAFTLDVAKPAQPNKAAVIYLVSGGWMSNHAMLSASRAAAVEKPFTDAGFTVFSVVHGTQPRYKVAEIVEQVQAAVRFVHEHAADYGIDTNKVGVTGISSGAHLALMIAGSAESPVNAVAALAPGTDLANFGKPGFILTDDPGLAMFMPALGFDPKGPRSDIEELAKKLSPITYVTAKYPPALIVHGAKDKLVPLQQAKDFDQALEKAGAPHKLEVIPGGGHDDKTWVPGVAKAVEWFKEKLLK